MSEQILNEKDPLEIDEEFLVNQKINDDQLKFKRLKERCKIAEMHKNEILISKNAKVKRRRESIKINIIECSEQEMERIREYNRNKNNNLKIIAVNKLGTPAITHLNIQPVASISDKNKAQCLDIDPLSYLNQVSLIREKFLEQTSKEDNEQVQDSSTNQIKDFVDLTV
ncbi:hypothetical protein O3M35_002686 [Rhynocoris fuscipes]|uniref:Uncharacterized protein n=1 Tax=Rhynocoris fuscipes TaxID=488301 RepID=A0AAW1CQ65_9HEMI